MAVTFYTSSRVSSLRLGAVRILAFSWRDLTNPRAGGAEHYMFEHARRWVRCGNEVTFFTSRFPGALSRERIGGVEIFRGGGPLSVRVAAYRWYRELRRRPDVVIDEIHGLPFGTPAFVETPVAAMIFEVAGDIWNLMFPAPLALLGRAAETTALRWYGRQRVPFITISRSTAQDLDSVGIPASRVCVIEPAINTVPLDVLPAKADTPTIVFVGRLVKMKGVEDALRALAIVRGSVPNCRLLLIGAGAPDYVSDLKALARRLGVGDAAVFIGPVDDILKLRTLRESHVLVHPSRHEGWGINVIEANAMATPAVAYNVPGLRDSIVDGETGLLCGLRKPQELAIGLRRLLTAPVEYAQMQRRCLAWSRRFNWEESSQRSLTLLRAISQ
ncbi:MAG: glycosyltransferase family 4 protein [Dehalococcoidia bacterium]